MIAPGSVPAGAIPLGSGAQAPILTVTLNPALDVATSAAAVVPELKLRCEAPVTDPGGGGINVSRAIARMGGQSTALVALGGAAGDRLAGLLEDAGLPVLRLKAPGDTRQSLSVIDRGTGAQFRFVLPGPEWSAADVGAALEAVGAAAPRGGIVVLSGSNPPGVPDTLAAMLARQLAGGAARLFVDTSGTALAAIAAGAGAAVEVLRMDDAEAESLAGRPLPARTDTADFAGALVAAGAARSVIVARGADGNIIAGPEGRWHAAAPPVRVISKVGAGDSFLAGYALGVARGLGAPDALALGAAAAAATCMTPATELCRPDDIARLYDQRAVSAL
ncbi:1-phosphofructokinase family hexose kinase [Paracoccus contaminans]|uniref:Phosphofructokinase n=1 Tax=Paracoccus contaminans TaxID=1945662 RepID=A0A1W6CVC4_9RHOB|nr:hexose kinase [Paracoccus contaminans]ARJ68810.1 sugar kinase [Paracoccus contaminans]